MKLNKQVPYLISRASSHLGASRARVLENYGLNLRAWRVLVSLDDTDGQIVSQLAREVLSEMSTLSRALDAMEKDGLVVKHRERPNARTVTVHITPHGRKIVKQTEPEYMRYRQALLDGLSQADIDAAIRVLDRLYDNAEVYYNQRRQA